MYTRENADVRLATHVETGDVGRAGSEGGQARAPCRHSVVVEGGGRVERLINKHQLRYQTDWHGHAP